MTTLAAHNRSRRAAHPLVGLTVATVVWVVLYHVLLPFWNWVCGTVLQLPADARWAEALHFFLYDTTKILLLLVGIIFVVRVLRTFISFERTRN